MTAIKDAKILIVATDGFEQSELIGPLTQLKGLGATVHVAAPETTREPGKIRGWNEKDWGDTVPVDKPVASVSVDDYDALVIPGGQINPDVLRVDQTVVALVRAFVDSGKTVAAICHGPWVLVEAGAVKGRRITSYHSIRTDVINAGGHWVDEPVVADEGIVTSRKPDDIDAFVKKIVEEIGEGRHDRRHAA
ncbi:type 1 glutamine amidotransferase domain-containing protein [Mongoliimonas terrestris]|uniref:type 1 glutamine amidotransferase domain-containing protein n=1 Tax=Mongoliimonas terrestris TaxID=1709001 RepID=UPI0009495CAC|nr:type 1 glutamine amidotransferase domain-containing protein [Mongoliimonas terrestris]